MAELSVVVVATDSEQRTVLQVLVDGTSVARTIQVCPNFPVGASDPALRRIQASNPDVVLVDIPSDFSTAALRAIELLHEELPDTAVFAVGTLSQPQVIVNAMRAGAREFIERPTTTTDVLEAFVRVTATQRRQRQEGPRGRVFSVVNAKGGCGSTTVAVNLALALQATHGHTALVDFAPLGHAALHLNVKPVFSLIDATRNLHRMDSSLMESFMTRHSGGLQLLAGPNAPAAIEPSNAEFVRLFDLMVTQYRYVVVDISSRLDAAMRMVAHLSEVVLLVAHTDVASLWSGARVRQYLGETGGSERVRLLLNRFRKLPGFDEEDAEAAVGAKLLWRVPNQYFAVSSAIDRGTPLMEQHSSEMARSFSGLAHELTRNDVDSKRAAWSMFKTV